MAGPQARHSPCRNFLPGSKNELARRVLTNGSNIHTPTLTASYILIFALTFAPLSNDGLFQ